MKRRPCSRSAETEPELVERGRAQVVDEPADVGERLARLLLAASASSSRSSSGLSASELGRRELHRDRRERRAEPVVQVAAQAPALLLARA